MKTISYTRDTHPANFKQCKTFGQLLAVIEKQGEADGLYISRIFLNEKLMDFDEENLLESMSVSQVKEIKVEMATIHELICKSMTSVIRSIQDTQTSAIKFAKEFRSTQSVDDEKVKFVLIKCRTIIESLEELFTSHMNGKFKIKHIPLWEQSETQLSNILQCILQGRKMSQADFLADLIEYDLVYALDQWEETIEKEIVDNQELNKIFSLKRGGVSSNNGVDA